jgi:hypothetical protein
MAGDDSDGGGDGRLTGTDVRTGIRGGLLHDDGGARRADSASGRDSGATLVDFSDYAVAWIKNTRYEGDGAEGKPAEENNHGTCTLFLRGIRQYRF